MASRITAAAQVDGMRKTTIRIGAVALAALFASGIAVAETGKDGGRKKKTLFEEIFGTSKKKKPQKEAQQKRRNGRVIFGRDWWNDDPGVRIINGQDGDQPRPNRNVVTVTDSDPEGDPGFGMGNLPYVAEKTVPLAGLQFKTARPAEIDSGAVYDALTGSEAALRVLPEIRDAISTSYAERGFRPVWLENGAFSARGKAVLAVLADADAEGLDAAGYLPPSLASYESPVEMLDSTALSRLDIELTAQALKYARDASGGRFDPKRLSLYHDVVPPRVPSSQSMKLFAWSPFPAEYLRDLHPKHPAYAAMKKALADLRNKTVALPADPIADGPVVKVGKIDDRIEAIRQRLADLGYAQALEASGDPQVFDADLSIQVRLFQKASGVKTSGLIGPQTVAALNNDTGERDTARLLNNIERLRWLPRNLGERHIFVNQPAFEVQVMERGHAIWTSRVIVGRPHTQTNLFHDEMETVVFNPSWGVPPSIIANEYLPKLRRDPGYLDRIGFKVVNASGKVVPSSSVNWSAYGNKVPFGIQQPPGDDNALGDIKFLFPNTHNIYMHDTPNRNLFEKDERAFSHGCVRVQNPRAFASVVLGWDAAKVDEHIATPKSETVRLAKKIPVHLTYFTAWPDPETGEIRYFNDIYGRDKTMETARSGLNLAQR